MASQRGDNLLFKNTQRKASNTTHTQEYCAAHNSTSEIKAHIAVKQSPLESPALPRQNTGHPTANEALTMNNDILKTLLAQEDELQLRYFNNQTAWELGTLIKSAADQHAAPIAIEIYAFEQVLFSYFMPGTNKDNQDWINRKRQSVMRFSHSSYYTGQYNAAKNRDFETIPHLDPKQYCAHGGSFPLRIKNSGLIGAVTVSGLAQEVDHQMVIDSLRKIIAVQAQEK